MVHKIFSHSRAVYLALDPEALHFGLRANTRTNQNCWASKRSPGQDCFFSHINHCHLSRDISYLDSRYVLASSIVIQNHSVNISTSRYTELTL